MQIIEGGVPQQFEAKFLGKDQEVIESKLGTDTEVLVSIAAWLFYSQKGETITIVCRGPIGPTTTSIDDDDTDRCTNPSGHEWACTGTDYGGDDESYHGEGRCYCIHCGADGDG